MNEENLGEDISSPDFKKLFMDYMVYHSDRKLNTLFWNLANPKQRLLIFSNLESNKLIRLNNSELIFRVIRVKNKKDWNLISDFINIHILKTTFEGSPATITIKIPALMSYLNNIQYDTNKIDVKMNNYFAYSYLNDKDKHIVIGNLERDYMALFRLSQMVNTFSLNEKSLTDDSLIIKEYNIIDIKELISEDADHIEVNIEDIDPSIKNIKTYITPGSELISLKQLKDLPNKSTYIYFIIKKITDEAFKFITMVMTPNYDIISIRPYLEYYKKTKKTKGSK